MMGLFSKLFGNAETAQAEKIRRDVEAQGAAVLEIGKLITRSIIECAESIRSLPVGNNEMDRHRAWTDASFELANVFLHMADRWAFIKLGPVKAKNLADRLRNLILPACVDGFCAQLSSEGKKNILSQVYTNLKLAEKDYVPCWELFIPEDRFSEKALLSRAARNVAFFLGRDGDEPTMLHVLVMLLEAGTKMRLDEVIEHAGNVL